MQGKEPKGADSPRSLQPICLSFFKSVPLSGLQEELTVELVPDPQDGHSVERFDTNSDDDCACE